MVVAERAERRTTRTDPGIPAKCQVLPDRAGIYRFARWSLFPGDAVAIADGIAGLSARQSKYFLCCHDRLSGKRSISPVRGSVEMYGAGEV